MLFAIFFYSFFGNDKPTMGECVVSISSTGSIRAVRRADSGRKPTKIRVFIVIVVVVIVTKTIIIKRKCSIPNLWQCSIVFAYRPQHLTSCLNF